MNHDAISSPKEQMKEFIPQALETALERYKDFSKQEETDSTNFKKHQEACKVAIAHIELLIKLSNATINHAQGINREEMSELMKKAHAEVEAYEKQKRHKEQLET